MVSAPGVVSEHSVSEHDTPMLHTQLHRLVPELTNIIPFLFSRFPVDLVVGRMNDSQAFFRD